MEQSEPFIRSSRGDGAGEEHGYHGQASPWPVVEVPVVAKHDRGSQYTGGFDDNKPPASVHGQKRRMWGKGWTTETLSFFISIAALGGLVATLLVHENKPLPQWPQLVTINSIISLFSLVMRACVGVVLAEGLSQCKWNWYRKSDKLDQMQRLDSASRGSWGSFTLLFHFKPTRAYYIAALGAATMILASLTGFFTQQIIQFQDCRQVDPAALTNISRTNSYARAGGQIQSNVHGDYAPMIAAINLGTLQVIPDQTNVLSSGCSSGNCTFSVANNASFSTVAIGHLCENYTSQIRVVNETTRNNSIQPVEIFLGLDFGTSNETFAWRKDNGGPILSSWLDTSWLSSSNSTEIAVMYFVFRHDGNTNDWKAARCSLFPTINTYAAKISDAILDEHPLHSTRILSPITQFKEPSVPDLNFTQITSWWPYKMTTPSTIRDGIEVPCVGSDKPAPDLELFPKTSDESTYVNATGGVNPSAGWKWWYYPRDCIWSMHKNSQQAMQATLGEIFDDQEASMGRKGGLMGSSYLQVLYQEGNITHATLSDQFANLTTAMTSVVRTAGGDGTLSYVPENAAGVVWINTTCVQIRWRWITFPAVMIGLTGIFLVLVAIANRGVESDRLWKSSLFAALFCEVEVDGREKLVGLEDMKATAKSTSVSLEESSGTLRLVSG